MLSATALIGLFFGFRFLITIFDLSLIIFPFHLLGLNALIGEMESFFEFKLNIGHGQINCKQYFLLELIQEHHLKLIL